MKQVLGVTVALLLLSADVHAKEKQRATFPFTCAGDCRLEIKWPEAVKAGAIRLPRDAGQAQRKNASATNVNVPAAVERAEPNVTITSATPLTIHVTNFNFLAYELEFDVKNAPVESYGYLETLWKQILGLGVAGVKGNAPTGGTADEFYKRMRAWRSKLRDTDKGITEGLEPYTEAGLTDDDVANIAKLRDGWVTSRTDIAKEQARVEEQLDVSPNLEKIQFFEATQKLHNEVEARLAAAIAAANLMEKGLTKTFSGLDSGNVVTITATPQDKSGVTAKPVVIQFFVNSELPVTYHVGLGYNRLGDVKFDKVKTVAGADLFTQVTSEKDAEDLVAFLSYQLGKFSVTGADRTRTLPLYASLGTDVTNPGESFYVGATMLVGRFFITAAMISGKVATGENKIIDTIVDNAGNQLGTRELFTTVRNRREWKPALAITFRPF